MQVDWWPSWGRQQPTPTPADLVKGASCLISTCVGFFEDRSSNLTGHSLDCVLQSARPWPCQWDPEIYTFQKLRASTQNGIGFKPMIKIKSQRKRTEEGPQARHIGGEFHTNGDKHENCSAAPNSFRDICTFKLLKLLRNHHLMNVQARNPHDFFKVVIAVLNSISQNHYLSCWKTHKV